MDLRSWLFILVAAAICLACAATGPGAPALLALSSVAIFLAAICLWLYTMTTGPASNVGDDAADPAQRLAGMQPVVLAALAAAFALGVARSDAAARAGVAWSRADDTYAYAGAARGLLHAVAAVACCAAAQQLRGRRPAVDLLWAVDFLPTAVCAVLGSNAAVVFSTPHRALHRRRPRPRRHLPAAECKPSVASAPSSANSSCPGTHRAAR